MNSFCQDKVIKEKILINTQEYMQANSENHLNHQTRS